MSSALKRLSHLLYKMSECWGWKQSIHKHDPLICPSRLGHCCQNNPEIQGQRQSQHRLCSDLWTKKKQLAFPISSFQLKVKLTFKMKVTVSVELCWGQSSCTHMHTNTHLPTRFRTCICPLIFTWYLRVWLLSMLQWHQLELGMGLSWKQHSGRVWDPSPGICPSDRTVQESHLHREGAVLKSTLHQF